MSCHRCQTSVKDREVTYIGTEIPREVLFAFWWGWLPHLI